MNNYIVINGKKAELTKEQLEQLGIETPKNLWIRASWTTREGEPCWQCPNCKAATHSYDEESLKIFHKYCGLCGHKNILDD